VNETQVIILARRSDLATVTDYAIVLRLYLVIVSVIQLGTSSFMPPFREAYERGDLDWARRAFQHLQRVRLLMAIGGGLGLVLLGNTVIRVWLHRGDVAFRWPVWVALAVLLLATVWGTAYVEFLWIMDRLWPLVVLVAMNGVTTVVLTWLTVPTHGVLGAVVASTVFTALVSSWALPTLARPLLIPATKSG